jgi:hypothetical protein
MKPADKAWVCLFVGVAVYELAAALRRWELLSEAADRYRQRHPIATHSTVVYLAGHLLRRWPQRFDPLHRLASRLSR